MTDRTEYGAVLADLRARLTGRVGKTRCAGVRLLGLALALACVGCKATGCGGAEPSAVYVLGDSVRAVPTLECPDGFNCRLNPATGVIAVVPVGEAWVPRERLGTCEDALATEKRAADDCRYADKVWSDPAAMAHDTRCKLGWLACVSGTPTTTIPSALGSFSVRRNADGTATILLPKEEWATICRRDGDALVCRWEQQR